MGLACGSARGGRAGLGLAGVTALGGFHGSGEIWVFGLPVSGWAVGRLCQLLIGLLFREEFNA